ncbi:hypothetical protein BGZ83_003888 [Gryganskiella cystojenkinii]|nr:hypothetical protein BGZ83_003888 [Gryganskiella cystojenkinii]
MWALDAEWKPFGGYKQQGKIALVQLGDDKTVYLFHVIHMRQFPKELARILENKQILKVGINIKADGIKIFKDWGVACASLVELGAVSIQVQDDLVSKRRVRSMETLTRELLGHSVEKVGITRMGNWESRNLTANQIAYAANDAFVTYEVAERIKELQRQRPDQKFTLSLATVHTQGSTILEVRGTLQERQDRAATAADIVETIQAKNTFIPGVRENNRFRLPWTASSTFSKAMTSWGSKVTAKTASEPFRLGVRQEQSPSSSATTSTISRSPSSRTSTSSMSSTKSVSAATPTFTYHPPTEDPHFYSKSWSDEIRTMTKGGGKTIVTIIPPRLQIPRSFCTLTRRNLFVATELVCKNTPSPAGAASSSSTKEEEKETKPSRSEGDIYFPGQLLPESLEGKNILERNQAVWLEAGGRQDLSEDRDDGEKDDGDWHMNQNQALFASLMSHHSHENDSDGGKEST